MIRTLSMNFMNCVDHDTPAKLSYQGLRMPGLFAFISKVVRIEIV